VRGRGWALGLGEGIHLGIIDTRLPRHSPPSPAVKAELEFTL
jgi:hypothetical protein